MTKPLTPQAIIQAAKTCLQYYKQTASIAEIFGDVPQCVEDLLQIIEKLHKESQELKTTVTSLRVGIVDEVLLTKQRDQAIKLLSDLVDLQNGAPLETHRKEWEETMKDIDNFLQSTQAKHD